MSAQNKFGPEDVDAPSSSRSTMTPTEIRAASNSAVVDRPGVELIDDGDEPCVGVMAEEANQDGAASKLMNKGTCRPGASRSGVELIGDGEEPCVNMALEGSASELMKRQLPPRAEVPDNDEERAREGVLASPSCDAPGRPIDRERGAVLDVTATASLPTFYDYEVQATAVSRESVYTAEPLAALPFWKQHARGIILAIILSFVVVTATVVGVMARREPDPEATPFPTPCPYLLCDSCVRYMGQMLEEDCNGCSPPLGIDGNTTVAAIPKEIISFWRGTENAATIGIDYDVGDVDGSGVAISGLVAVVGSPQDNTYSGSVYVYAKDPPGDAWTQDDQIFPHDPSIGAKFGRYVDIDGDVIVVGSWDYTGSVYVFRRSNGTWVEETKLAPGESMNKDFGGVAKVKGNRITVGDRMHGFDPEGIVYLYEYNESSLSWNLEHTVSNKECDGRFGVNLALAGDNELMVGCPFDDGKQGSVYVYQLMEGKYELRQKLIASSGSNNNRFGQTQQIAVDRDTMAIGEYVKTGGRTSVFTRQSGNWTEVANIGSPALETRYFGDQVLLSRDKMVVASSDNAYVYDLEGCIDDESN